MDIPAGYLFGDEKEWVEAVALYEGTLKKWNMPASGLALGDPKTVAMMARGRSFMVTTSDMFSLMGQGLQELGHMRGNFPAQDYAEIYKPL